MTALVFTIQPDQICLAMDTLVVDPYDKTPLYYQTKFTVLPHINLVIAGTGLAPLINGWFHFVNGCMVVRDIDHLNPSAPRLLRDAAARCLGTDLTTTTMYHFGYSAIDNRYVGYAYRSAENWEPDRLQDALGVKPVVDVQPTDKIQFPEFFINIVKEQRRRDLLLPLSDRIGIGGDIQFVILENGVVTISNVHRFDSYESDYELMVRKNNAR
jgi:hypothetical protein